MEGEEAFLNLKKPQALNIDIGTKVYLTIEGVSFNVSSIFVGLLDDEYVIITLPQKYKTVQTKLYPGNKMIVKYLYNGSLYAFQAAIIEIITRPIRAIAIEYPKIVQNQDLRVVRRNNVAIPGRVEFKSHALQVVVFDVSRHGCCFRFQETRKSKVAFKENDTLKIYCLLPGVSNELSAMASIRNIRREDATLSIGVEFFQVNNQFISPLTEFIASIGG
ncbi:flagellar brake protein [uncultured Desulfobacter sp.]|uniref:flagellar brake protein n=1 Tax=uncultured Desulfobacter sp. TaxID=240139 RepID=UPI0029F48AB5|nr:flagellar brake protein [uncultured Desulfobacter sp.]